ncbi:hypothetical protein EJ02DRAFT_480315 [Clathrospora elynae]|uniref:Uncharacterized protein n=1 Tax=Clathrospora elynae TaxID=706981 RepID=A0A6A5SXK5_9PLEO|nr:hypothetical protein EJ02DRAFT_480315 [Clathrospora elynae]
MPDCLNRRILDLISLAWDSYQCTGETSEVFWDLDKKTMTGASVVLGAVCFEFRLDHVTRFWKNNRHMVKTATSQVHTDFGRFQDIERLWNARRWLYVWHTGPYEDSQSRLEALLEFQVGSGVTLESIRVNITGLLLITREVPGSAKIIISILGEEGESIQKTTTSLERYREVGLATIHKGSISHHRVYSGKRFPAVWMNGRCEVIEVDLTDLSEVSKDTSTM